MRRIALLGLTTSLLFPATVGAIGSSATAGVPATAVTAPAPVAEAIAVPDFTYTPCLEVTDSVYRLYTAYFLRAPDAVGFDYWLSEYSNARRNLEEVSLFFSQSDEFRQRYGDLNNGEYVYLVYREVMEREPDAGGYNYWLSRLDSGEIDRGQMMISFSESEEYVLRSQTATPSAGYFSWYPTGTTWGCSYGSSVLDRTSDSNMDLMFTNASNTPQSFTFTAVIGGVTGEPTNIQLEAWETVLWTFTDAPADFERFEVTGSDDIHWGIVFMPTPLPHERGGWSGGAGLTSELGVTAQADFAVTNGNYLFG